MLKQAVQIVQQPVIYYSCILAHLPNLIKKLLIISYKYIILSDKYR